MEKHRRRLVEILAFFAVFSAVYLLVVGPAIGDAFGFDRPAFSGPNDRPTGELPDTPRGWILVGLLIPGHLGYMYVRARLAGQSMGEFWNPSEERRERDQG